MKNKINEEKKKEEINSEFLQTPAKTEKIYNLQKYTFPKQKIPKIIVIAFSKNVILITKYIFNLILI